MSHKIKGADISNSSFEALMLSLCQSGTGTYSVELPSGTDGECILSFQTREWQGKPQPTMKVVCTFTDDGDDDVYNFEIEGVSEETFSH